MAGRRVSLPAQLIALDWGSSRLRGWLLGAGGAVLAARSSEAGASTLGGDAAGFAQALHALVGPWQAATPGLPLLACGMVGSAHGWREAAYLPCPVALQALAAATTAVPLADGATLHILPGVCQPGGADAPDVMRGEETQVAGLLQREPALAAQATLVLPGTHSKWVAVRGGAIAGFHTHMTGELYALLRGHSVLARLMPPQDAGWHEAAFVQGVQAAARADAAGLGQLLFGVRTRGLFKQLAPEALADYLSGLLIGSELRSALPQADPGAPLRLVGEPALCRRYALALAQCGRTAGLADADATVAGLWALGAALLT